MSIIGNAILAGGGGGSKTLLIRGAPNEVVTYFGATAGTVTLDATGNGTVALRTGTYSFTGGVSGYTKSNVVVDRQTADINVWPGTALYWYGRANAQFDYSGQMSTGYPAYSDDHVTLYRSFPTKRGSFFFTLSDLTDYSSLHAIGYTNSSSVTTGPLVSTQSSFDFDTSNRILASGSFNVLNIGTEVTVDISDITGSRYVGIGGYTYNEYNNIKDTVYAIWLE